MNYGASLGRYLLPSELKPEGIPSFLCWKAIDHVVSVPLVVAKASRAHA